MENVFITGMGVISSLGNTSEELFTSLVNGECAFKYMPEWKSLNGLETHVAAPAKKYECTLPRKIRRSMSPMAEMSFLATVDALNDAKISIKEESGKYKIDTLKTVLMMGSTSGSPIFLEGYYKKLFENGGPKGQLSGSFFKIMNHSIPTNVALALGYSGPLISPSSACSTSSQAAILAAQLIRAGIYDVAIVGGADELHHTSVSVFDTVKASSKSYNECPEKIPGPFDHNRDGLVVSEGAGVIVLESETHLKNRGGNAYAQFVGGSYICDGIHMSQPQASQMATTIDLALADSGIDPTNIDYINAHATGTKIGDGQEIQGINSIFGNKQVPISSIKGHMGHSLAACGTIEIICIIQMMKNSTLIGTRNVNNTSKEFDNTLILSDNLESTINFALSNNFAFGGMNTSLVLKNVM